MNPIDLEMKKTKRTLFRTREEAFYKSKKKLKRRKKERRAKLGRYLRHQKYNMLSG